MPGDFNGKRDVFLYEVKNGALTRVSKPADGETDGDSMRSSVSADGRFIAYFSQAKNLVEGDTNNTVDVFIWDAQTGRTRHASPASDGKPSRGGSQFPILSGNGRVVAFHAFASDLVADDRNNGPDVFVRALHHPP